MASSSTIELTSLFNTTQTFSAAATQLSQSSKCNTFTLLIRLHDFLTQNSHSNHSDESVLSARMKAEWCLWQGYQKWELNLNPFLGYFVQMWESGGDGPDIIIIGIILSGQAGEVNIPFVHRIVFNLY